MLKKLSVFLIVLLMITGCAVQPGSMDNQSVDSISKDEAPFVAVNLVTNGSFEKYNEKTLIPTDWNFYNGHSYKSITNKLLPTNGRSLEIIIKENDGPCVFSQGIKFNTKIATFNFSMFTKSDVPVKLKITLGSYTKIFESNKGGSIITLKFKSIVSEKTALWIDWLYPYSSQYKISPLYIDDIELYDTTVPL